MNNLERQLLAAGMTIFQSYKSKYYFLKNRLNREERLIWFNEKAKGMGYKVFTVSEMEHFTRMNKKEIRKIIREMVNKGYIK